MSVTITSNTQIELTSRRSRNKLASARSAYGDLLTYHNGEISLNRGDDWTITFSKLLFVFFKEKTLIRLTIGSTPTPVDLEVKGSLLLPTNGSVFIEHASDSPTTTPLVFTYVAG